MARLARHRRTKGPVTDRPNLHHRVTPRLYSRRKLQEMGDQPGRLRPTPRGPLVEQEQSSALVNYRSDLQGFFRTPDIGDRTPGTRGRPGGNCSTSHRSSMTWSGTQPELMTPSQPRGRV